ncbi:hypothetical protein ACFV0L_41315 [Streptosporangium canum]|uniref:hypothetical protein n=1 Tax=Streptosporangium canum TaxID=324952 RepID=UPI0036A41FF3
MSKRVGLTDIRRMRQRRIAALIAKSQRRGKQARTPEQVAFTTLLHRLKKKHRARPHAGTLAGAEAGR